MRKPHILEALTWYWVITAVNRHEPVFLDRAVVDLFNRVLREAGERFALEVRRLIIQADRVSFYIKPADGFQLPVVMQWTKQTFACRWLYPVSKFWPKLATGEMYPEDYVATVKSAIFRGNRGICRRNRAIIPGVFRKEGIYWWFSG
jgi:hypothetical protein